MHTKRRHRKRCARGSRFCRITMSCKRRAEKNAQNSKRCKPGSRKCYDRNCHNVRILRSAVSRRR